MDKISINQIKEMTKHNKKEVETISVSVGDNNKDNITIEINNSPKCEDWVSTIRIASMFVYGSRYGTGLINESIEEEPRRNPELYSVAFAYAVIRCFTNLKTENTEVIFDLVTQTDIYDAIVEKISASKLERFKEDYDSAVKLGFEAGKTAGVASAVIDVAGGLSSVIEKLAQLSDSDFGEGDSDSDGLLL